MNRLEIIQLKEFFIPIIQSQFHNCCKCPPVSIENIY